MSSGRAIRDWGWEGATLLSQNSRCWWAQEVEVGQSHFALRRGQTFPGTCRNCWALAGPSDEKTEDCRGRGTEIPKGSVMRVHRSHLSPECSQDTAVVQLEELGGAVSSAQGGLGLGHGAWWTGGTRLRLQGERWPPKGGALMVRLPRVWRGGGGTEEGTSVLEGRGFPWTLVPGDGEADVEALVTRQVRVLNRHWSGLGLWWAADGKTH